MAAKKLLANEREALKKSIASGKIKGRSLKKAIGRIYYINGQLKKVEQPKRRVGRPKGKKADVNQMHLPNFLTQMPVVNLQEIVRERVIKLVDAKVEQFIAKAFKVG